MKSGLKVASKQPEFLLFLWIFLMAVVMATFSHLPAEASEKEEFLLSPRTSGLHKLSCANPGAHMTNVSKEKCKNMHNDPQFHLQYV